MSSIPFDPQQPSQTDLLDPYRLPLSLQLYMEQQGKGPYRPPTPLTEVAQPLSAGQLRTASADEIASSVKPGGIPHANVGDLVFNTPNPQGGQPSGQAGDFGLAGIQQRLLNEAGRPAVGQGQLEQLRAIGQDRASAAEKFGEEQGRLQSKIEGIAATEETLLANRNAALSDAKEKMNRAALRAQYPTLTLDEIERYRSIADDKTGAYSEQQKRAAELSLQRAGTIDPNRLFNRGTGPKIMAVIAQALGAYASAMSHGRIPNFGMQAVNQAIERDIYAQKAAFDAADRRAGYARSVYADMFKEFDDERQALAATKATLLNGAAMLAEKYKASDLAQQLRQQSLQLEMQVGENESSRRLNALVQAGKLASDRSQLDLAARKAGAKGAGKALPASAANLIGGYKAALKNLDNLWEKYKDKTSPASGPMQYVPGTDSHEFRDDVHVAAQVIGKMLEGGKLSDKDVERYLGMMPQPGDLKSRAQNKIEALRSMLKTKLKDELKAYGDAGYDISGLVQGETSYGAPPAAYVAGE